MTQRILSVREKGPDWATEKVGSIGVLLSQLTLLVILAFVFTRDRSKLKIVVGTLSSLELDRKDFKEKSIE